MNYPLKKRYLFSGGRDDTSINSTNESMTNPESPPAPWDSEPPPLIPLDSLNSPHRPLDVYSNFSSHHQCLPISVDHQQSIPSESSLQNNSIASAYRSLRSSCDSQQSHRHCDCPNNSASYSSTFNDAPCGTSSHYLGVPIDDIVDDMVDFFNEVMQKRDDKYSVAHNEIESKSRIQKCSFCLNHGLDVLKKGHKWECPFAVCECPRCKKTKRRQMIMREQQKLTRELRLHK